MPASTGGTGACWNVGTPPAHLADEVAVRRKRAGHLSSKGRMLAAQILALIKDDLFATSLKPASFDLVHARFELTPLGRVEEQLAAVRGRRTRSSP